jgi:PAS domain S-box-containing protein
MSQPRSTTSSAPFLIAGFAMLSLVVLMQITFSTRERMNNATIQNALVAEDRLVDVLSTIRLGESGLRGYLLTGNHFALDGYHLALSALPDQLTRLDTAMDGSDPQNLAQVHQLIAQKEAQLTNELSIGPIAAAAAQVDTDLNLGTMRALRDLIGTMRTTQTTRITATEAGVARDSAALQSATVLAIFLTVLMAWLAIRESRAQTAQLRITEAALLRANEGLEQQVAARTATLAASEAQFRSLAETMPGFVYITNPAGETIYNNPQYLAYSGQKPAEAMGFGWTGNIHQDDLPACLAAWQACISTGALYELEFRLRRHDGAYRWFLNRAQPIRDSAGFIISWIGSSTDIEDRKKAEAAMAYANAGLERRVAERSRQLDRIFKLSTDLLAVADFSGQFISVSPAWEQITGLPLTTALAGNYFDFLHPDHVATARADFAALAEGKPVFCENRYRRADGSWCWLAWRAVPMPEEQRIYAVARDVTVAREREEQLRQSQKMEVVGQLTGGVAHDFNNLLTIIMGSLEMLQRGLPPAELKLQRRVDTAMDGARRAAALTHRLLAFSRRQPLTPKPLDIARLLASMSDMLHRTLGEPIEVELVNAAGLWPALADSNQLENAILNLAVNARDAMPNGGKLTIETQNTYLDEAYTTLRGDMQPGQYVMVAVTDTGTGMSAAVQEKVFEPFFTTKPQGEGTGLGLAQVYGFIKQSGGHVNIYSEPGQGTSVKLYLPRLRGEAATESAAETQTGTPARGRREKILLVEDEDGVRQFSAEVMEELGYQVFQAATAQQALDILAGEPAMKLLFTDVVLTGGINGRQLAAEIQHRRPDMLVLFTTGYTRNAIIHHGRLDDGINFIGKPFTATALGQKIAALLETAAAN